MSRRKRQRENVHHAYGGVRLKCPYGHVLGLAVLQHGQYMLGHGLTRVDGPGGETKIKARCAPCEAEGVARDLQGSWAKVRSILDQHDRDPAASVVDYVVGGTPVS